jgi:nucleoside-diphosphate-sugar epimerase
MDSSQNKLVFEDCLKSCIDIECLSKLENQSIFVTGGTGFIGKWLAEMISYINETSGFNIKLYLMGTDVRRFQNEMPHLSEKSFITLIEEDIRNLKSFPNEISYIIHAAGSPDNRLHVSDPIKTIEVFYKGTKSVLDAATRVSNLKKIVHISSHQVYGKNDNGELIDENFIGLLDASSFNNCYSESKRISETLCNSYMNHAKLPIVILRPFAFIGPYQSLDKPWAINSFIRDGLLGGPIRILGNPDTERSYLYASDMAFGILKLLVDGKVGEKYNLGSNHSITLNELASKIQKILGLNIDILNKSSKDIYPNLSKIVPDTSKIVKYYNFKESFDIDESIHRTILWNKLNKKY